MDVKILNSADRACESFLAEKPRAMICHTYLWTQAIVSAVGHQPFYLAAFDGAEVCGVLPLIYVRSHLFGNFMVSQAFSDYGGVIANSTKAVDSLFNYAVELGFRCKCDFIEFRGLEMLPYELHLRKDKMTMHLPLSANPDNLWQNFRPEIRNRVRKAKKEGLTVIDGGIELLQEFYRVWTVRMHQLGTPCYPIELMSSILKTFPRNSRIFIVRLEDNTLGAGFCVSFNRWVDMQWVATLVKYNKMAPNVLLYWSVIEHYCKNGMMWFDFGRFTVGSSTEEFKRRWGPKEVQLYYQYWVPPGRQLSHPNPASPKYRRMVGLWKRMPLCFTRLVGPMISRNLP